MRKQFAVPLLCLCLFASAAPAAAPLAERIPGRPLLYAGWAGRNAAFDESLFGQLLDTVVGDSLIKAIEDQIKTAPAPDERKAAGHAWQIAKVAWKHSAAAALLDIGKTEEAPVITACLLIDLQGDREAFAKELDGLMAPLREEMEFGKASAGDVSYATMPTPVGLVSFGYMDTFFFMALGKDVPGQLANLKKEASLAADARFAADFGPVDAKNLQGAVYVDVAGLLKKVQIVAGPDAEELRSVLGKLGAGKISSLAGAAALTDGYIHSRLRIASPAPHRGLLMPLAGKPLTDADLAAVPHDALLAVAANLSPSELFGEFRRVLKSLEPSAEEEFMEGLAAMEQDLGLSVENELLAGLGDTWVLSSAPSLGGLLTGTLLTAEVTDPVKLAGAIGKIEAFFKRQMDRNAGGRPGPRIEEIAAGDATIKYVSMSGLPSPVAPAWCIHENTVYVALWPQVIATALDRSNGTSILQNKDFAAARASLGGAPCILQYINTPAIVRRVYHWILVGWSLAANMAAEETGVVLKPHWLPPVGLIEQFLRPAVMAVSADKQGITLEGRSSLPGLSTVFSPLTGGAAAVAGTFLQVAGDVQSGAVQSKRATDINTLNCAAQLYYAETGAFPRDLTALVESGVQAAVDKDGDGDVDNNDTCGPWIDEVPLDPSGKPYRYDPQTGRVSAPAGVPSR